MPRVYDDRPHPDEVADMRNDGVPLQRWDVVMFAASAVFGAVLMAAIVLCFVGAAPFFQNVIDDITARPEACRHLTGAECTALAQDGGW